MKGLAAMLAILVILGASQYLPAADTAPGGSAAEPSPPAVEPSPAAVEPSPAATEPAPAAPAPSPAAAGTSPPAAEAQAYPEGLVVTVEKGATLWDLSAKYLGSPGAGRNSGRGTVF